jgi:hypothetical protein
VLLYLAASVSATAEQKATEERVFAFGAWVELSAEGRVIEASLPPGDTALPAVLHEPLLQIIKELIFEPARRKDGAARPSRSWLQGRLRLVPQGDNYELLVQADQLGPRPLQPFRARTGRPPDKPVRLLLTFEVTAEGRTRNVEITTMDRTPSGITKNVADSLEALRFEPEKVDGQPVATTLRWPFQVRRSTSEELAFELPPVARDPQRPGVPGQNAYALPIIITAVFRGAGNL